MCVTPQLLRVLETSGEKIFDDDVDEPAPARTPGDDDPPRPVVDPASLPYVLSAEQAAALLATSVKAVYNRVDRGQLDGRHGLLKVGRKVQFLRDRLLKGLEKMADEQTPRRRR
jgi:hypothetical protein